MNNLVANQAETVKKTDIQLARNFISKADNSAGRGIPFELSFTAYKNLMRAKRCKITGVELTTPRSGKDLLLTDRTIDRVDSSKGYIKGNVIAVCHAVNSFKSFFENAAHNKIITPAVGIKILKKMLELEAKSDKVEVVETPKLITTL